MQPPASFLSIWKVTVGVFCSSSNTRMLLGHGLKASQAVHHFLAFITAMYHCASLPCCCTLAPSQCNTSCTLL